MMTTDEAVLNDRWARYEPSVDAPWNLRRVVHLHRRAGFAASRSEVDRDLADGPDASIGRLLSGMAQPSGAPDPEEFERISTVLADAAIASSDSGRLKAWWFYRLLFSPDPLGERLTLMWHNHFATSNQKVNDPTAMRRQNELFRKLARAPFGELLEAAIRDPALLAWLDAPANRKGHPNENLGRELLELFSVGIGHYSEDDVKETARALTGWSVTDGEAREVATRHDDEPKTILGRTGKWRASDVVRIVLDHKATADRLAFRVCELLMGENVERPAIESLSIGMRANHLDIGWAVATVLRSHAFFAAANLGTRVQSPVEFIVGAVRALDMLDPPPSTLVLADWAARLGQDVFNPPNVGGWPGGRSWLSARALIGRVNFATALVEGHGVGRETPLDPIALASRYRRRGNRHETISFCGELLLGVEPDRRWIDQSVSKATWNPESARQAIAQLMAAPEAQLS
jgi:uncharacterized protein (DUF1800 family)